MKLESIAYIQKYFDFLSNDTKISWRRYFLHRQRVLRKIANFNNQTVIEHLEIF